MSDKYPDDSGRRRFVKGVVGGATLAGVGATTAAAVNSATMSSGSGGGTTQAMAIENIAGPAPRGMPQIPIEIDSEGYLKGVWPEVKTIEENGVQIQVAETENYKGSGVTYTSEWFQYCGVESYGGIDPEYDSDNYFISGAAPGYTWQSDAYSEGDRLHVDDFSDYQTWSNDVGDPGLGKPATGRWRSEEAENVIPIQVIRSEEIEQMAQDDPWVQASTQEGFVAWLNKCTHFCCVPGYKTEGSGKFNAANDVYCQCHQSVYDPFSLVETLFVARPRPSE
ncbi:ubiquinol-cytochrome c reductase iron-sulfur subunit [Halogeometricum sp. S1BR25-6]|uniref:Ubiquinol-cytochrome c reductase iron-sulfur subunit n=1 Tax=Halogeometricum salsisoli TaxID=2950536 RepID=A0ABU2GH77_9EURY|nr:ubiquinol-cytochrome c reductase iron-sulfur subunit [Halogeometricum sp. S1BR25-6]MDS0299514.1 ubiquinol-cytochrome c reductase iron-sulfur subunit [Halogeometricum sp. S1BR25-6]